jgi:hypothetical protein
MAALPYQNALAIALNQWFGQALMHE